MAWCQGAHTRIGVWFDISLRVSQGSTVEACAEADVVVMLPVCAFMRERCQGLRLTGGDDQGPQDIPERQARAGDGLPNGHLHVGWTARE